MFMFTDHSSDLETFSINLFISKLWPKADTLFMTICEIILNATYLEEFFWGKLMDLFLGKKREIGLLRMSKCMNSLPALLCTLQLHLLITFTQ